LNKSLLTQTNFQYAGRFYFPGSYNTGPNDYCTRFNDGCSTAFTNGGLAFRFVNGSLHFFTTGHAYAGGQVYEFNYPYLDTTGVMNSGNTAQVLHDWGYIYTNAQGMSEKCYNNTTALCPNDSGGQDTYGLLFDPDTNRLYWSAGNWYDTMAPPQPTVGYSVLNDATGVATGMGEYYLSSPTYGIRGSHLLYGGFTPIPEWFAASYTGGKTLGVGFGGYYSIVGNGGGFGPAVAAIAPPNPQVNPDRSGLDYVPLVGYEINSNKRAHRFPDYVSAFESSGGSPNATTPYYIAPDAPYPTSWNPQYSCTPTYPSTCNLDANPRCADPVFPAGCATTEAGQFFNYPPNSVGFWSWDYIFQGCTWIDTTDLGGLLCIGKTGTGAMYYNYSHPNYQGSNYLWMVYDPKDLASVAAGQKQQHDIFQASYWYDPTLALDPNGFGSNEADVTFVPNVDINGQQDTTKNGILFVMDISGPRQGCEAPPVMYVYKVCNSDGSGC